MSRLCCLCRLCQYSDIYLNRKRVFVQGTNSICDALRDLVSVGQFKKRKKTLGEVLLLVKLYYCEIVQMVPNPAKRLICCTREVAIL